MRSLRFAEGLQSGIKTSRRSLRQLVDAAEAIADPAKAGRRCQIARWVMHF